ncbi:hypothetical protein [Pseudanabaena sp. PCC 6802]|uniref:hypothetical protein n=1 Tax=Pseudanabaena sp. PCC 6802 TaxID=118173 RepID=UPI0012E9A1CB|nr:hypothetical protein [Pseudanabaena sp. PCC 6802]
MKYQLINSARSPPVTSSNDLARELPTCPAQTLIAKHSGIYLTPFTDQISIPKTGLQTPPGKEKSRLLFRCIALGE